MLSALIAVALAATSPEPDRLAVIAVDATPSPTPDLVEMTHQLRAACRERDSSVQDVHEMRVRLLGGGRSASLAELERAFTGALLTASQGDAEGGARTLRGIVEELERGPDSAEAFEQWTRAELRRAHLELAAGNGDAYREALDRVAEAQPRLKPDPDQFSPTFRRDLEAARARVAARPHHALRVTAIGPPRAEPLAVFVDGRPVGVPPLTVHVASGRHRVAAAAGELRVPAVHVDVGDAPDATAEAKLDAELAAAVNVNAGPAIALPRAGREVALMQLAAWLDAARVVATSVATEGGARFLVGSLYDARRGALMREGRVRTAAGVAAPEHVAALSSFLLTGKPSAAVVTATAGALASQARTIGLSPASQQPRPPAAWLRPVAIGSGVAAVGAGVFALAQRSAAEDASRKADALVRSDGTYVGDAAAWARHHDAAIAARRNVWIGAAGTAVFAATAGVLGYLSWDRGAPVVRF